MDSEPLKIVARIPWSLLAAFWITTGSGGAAVLPQEAYVWQRAWTPAVRQALLEHGGAFSRLTVLRAEVTWKKEQPQLAQVAPDYATLLQIKRPVGLALRIGPYSSSFSGTNVAAAYLADLSQKLLGEAKRAGLEPSELQLDFDCASSKLEGYRAWVELIAKRVSPTPLTITALPAWLDRREFKELAHTAGSYILQVHSLERPSNISAPFTICDPASARSAVAKASALGIPFRVALPSYGYVLAFDAQGRFLGLTAEGPQKRWPARTRLKEARANPMQMAQLLASWSSKRPPALQGVIWYRLPVAGDVLNWRWPTFNAMVEARLPRKSVRAKAHRVEAGLIEISLVNDGELDLSSRLAVQTRWHSARLIAGDGLGGFELTGQEVSAARFEIRSGPGRLSAGEEQVIGWLRLNEDREVELELQEFDGP